MYITNNYNFNILLYNLTHRERSDHFVLYDITHVINNIIDICTIEPIYENKNVWWFIKVGPLKLRTKLYLQLLFI